MSDAHPFTHTAPEAAGVLEEIKRLEPIFHSTRFGTTREEFASRMAPEFWEVGASGRRYSRDFILANAEAIASANGQQAGWMASGHALRELGPETYLYTYTLDQAGRLSRRATIWRRVEDQWRILYHQGTLATGLEDDTTPA